ncbi:hypothetical protein Salat_2781100 [Sesamum alatum]|uniref:Uncharacterized protein n=1 Tax=Sesamum alatum TaxID=300844 RepID=A0AAE1XLP1_9LAMI|nr:hypothetical protein Salat_2781100 [Sesamum alatum]
MKNGAIAEAVGPSETYKACHAGAESDNGAVSSQQTSLSEAVMELVQMMKNQQPNDPLSVNFAHYDDFTALTTTGSSRGTSSRGAAPEASGVVGVTMSAPLQSPTIFYGSVMVDVQAKIPNDVQTEVPNEVQIEVQASKLTARKRTRAATGTTTATTRTTEAATVKNKRAPQKVAMTPSPNSTMSTVTPSPLPHVNMMPAPPQIPRDGKKIIKLNNLNTMMETVQAKKKSKTTASKE